MAKDLQDQDKKKSEVRLQEIQSRAAQIGDVEDLKATIDRLQTLRGHGGSESKRQRFADGAMNVLSTSITVGSARLEDAKPKE